MDILQVTDELESLVETGVRVPGFRKKVLVDIGKLTNLGESLRDSVPANIQEAQEILKQKESIVNQAYLEAQRIRDEATRDAQEIKSIAQREHHLKVDESEIVKASESRAEEIKDQAMMESALILQDSQRRAFEIQGEMESLAEKRREGADAYAREVLCNLEEHMAQSLAQIRRGIDALRSGEDIDIVTSQLTRESAKIEAVA